MFIYQLLLSDQLRKVKHCNHITKFKKKSKLSQKLFVSCPSFHQKEIDIFEDFFKPHLSERKFVEIRQII